MSASNINNNKKAVKDQHQEKDGTNAPAASRSTTNVFLAHGTIDQIVNFTNAHHLIQCYKDGYKGGDRGSSSNSHDIEEADQRVIYINNKTRSKGHAGGVDEDDKGSKKKREGSVMEVYIHDNIHVAAYK